MNQLEKIFQENKDDGYFSLYAAYLSELLSAIAPKSVSDVADCFLEAREGGATIFFVGNGGSAATASHFAQDLTEVGRKASVKSFKTLSLTDNVAFLTAVGNDYGYDKIFSIQMAELFQPGDVLVAISASGNSPNVVEAAKYAKELKGKTVGLVGFDGGALSGLCDYVIHAKSNRGEYGPVEDVHMILDHMITSYLILKLSSAKEK